MTGEFTGAPTRGMPQEPGRDGAVCEGDRFKPPPLPYPLLMLTWAIVLGVASLVAAALGFGGVAGALAGVAKILFFLFLVAFAVLLVLALMAGSAVT